MMAFKLKTLTRILAVAGVLIVLALILLFNRAWFDPQLRHQERALALTHYSLAASRELHVTDLPATYLHGEARTRGEACAAISFALSNILCSRAKCDVAKFDQLFERIQRSNGADFKTVEGCLRLIDEMEVVCPDVRDYIWFLKFRALQDAGIVAKLPHPTTQSETQGSVPLPNSSSRKILKEVAPDYPAYLREKKIAGAVIVLLWVRPDGAVERTEARYSAHPELIPLATAAVEKWVFEPAPEGDKRVLVLEMPISFSL